MSWTSSSFSLINVFPALYIGNLNAFSYNHSSCMKSIQGGERNHQREILLDKDAISPDMRISALVLGLAEMQHNWECSLQNLVCKI